MFICWLHAPLFLDRYNLEQLVTSEVVSLGHL